MAGSSSRTLERDSASAALAIRSLSPLKLTASVEIYHSTGSSNQCRSDIRCLQIRETVLLAHTCTLVSSRWPTSRRAPQKTRPCRQPQTARSTCWFIKRTAGRHRQQRRRDSPDEGADTAAPITSRVGDHKGLTCGTSVVEGESRLDQPTGPQSDPAPVVKGFAGPRDD